MPSGSTGGACPIAEGDGDAAGRHHQDRDWSASRPAGEEPGAQGLLVRDLAGARLPRHEHPWSRYAYVLAGELAVTFDGGLTKHYKAGDFIVEGVNAWHYGENTGHETVRLLVIDQTEAGQSNTVLAP